MTDSGTEASISQPTLVAYGLHHHGVTVTDLDRSVRFYQEAFGAKVEFIVDFGGEGPSRIVRVPGAQMRVASMLLPHGMLELVQYLAPEGRPYDRTAADVGTSHLCLEVEDIERAYQWMQELGVDCRYPPQHVYEGPRAGLSFFYLHDPDGLPIELLQYHKPGHPQSIAACSTSDAGATAAETVQDGQA
ncbi:hypothetical protein GCM10022222_38640 [Amycolatopsis ultiminotia]|uniref:VOC domain-containing protein n=1 Tax=Amycolatopsis ultiminotia TaxID=543629 RepID=A0ABP6WHR3_9PSEU